MSSLKKQVFFCTMSSFFEWYEFLVFALMTPIISVLFFPHSNHFAAMMSTFAVFASGYLMRPIGAVFFGHFGDTIGRRYTLMITLFLMTGSTVAMGCIPVGHNSSAVILLLCRLLQGFSASGEYPAVLTLLSEQNAVRRKGFITSTAPFGTGMGCLFGAILCAVMFRYLGHDVMLQGGWRIPFLLALPLGILSFIFRRKISESSAFQKISMENKTLRIPVLKLFSQHARNLIGMLFISILANVTIYMNFFYVGNYLVAMHKITTLQSSYLYLWTILVYSVAIIVFGFLSDYVNKKIFLSGTCILIVLASYPLFSVIFSGDFHAQFLAQGVVSLFSGMVLGPFVSVLSEGFPTNVRYTALSVVLNMAGSLFGGTSPMVCGWLTTYWGPTYASAGYLIFLSVMALIAILWIVQSSIQEQDNKLYPVLE